MTAEVRNLRERREQMRREADRIGRARPDAVLALADAKARHPSVRSTCPPHAARLHRIAALITTEDLPTPKITITRTGDVTVDLTGSELVQSDVRQWSAALGLDPVTEAASAVNGWAAQSWSTSGYVDGAHFLILGTVLLPTPITDRFGCGIGPAT